jgi:hypothetical protein
MDWIKPVKDAIPTRQDIYLEWESYWRQVGCGGTIAISLCLSLIFFICCLAAADAKKLATTPAQVEKP